MSKNEEIDISKVREEHIISHRSKIPISCVKCNYEWFPSIHNLISNKSHCPECSQVAPYTLERFRKRMFDRKEINISEVKENHIININSLVTIFCNICEYKWKTAITNLVNGCGCPNCAGNARYDLERFKNKMVLREEIDISEVTEEHIKNKNSKVPVICTKCNYRWSPRVYSLTISKNGCPKCKISKGIIAITNFLDEMSISYELEKTFKNLKVKSYLRLDIYIHKFNEILYPICLEYDGNYPGSHFSYRDDEEKRSHILTVKRDKIKDEYVLKNKIHMIRIPYTCFPNKSSEDLIKRVGEVFEILKGKDPTLILLDEKNYTDRDINLKIITET